MAGKKEAQFAFGKQRGARLVKSEKRMLGRYFRSLERMWKEGM